MATDNKLKINAEPLLEVVQSLLEATDFALTCKKLLDNAMTFTSAERGYLLVRDENQKFEPIASQGIEPGKMPSGDPSRAIVETALRERRPVISRDASKDPRFSSSESIIIRGIRSACCLPLESRGIKIGALYLDTSGIGKLTEEMLPLLEVFSTLAGLVLGKMLELDTTKKALQANQSVKRFGGIIGESKVMSQLYNRLERIANADLPVLITGESGTGKELAARAIHQNSTRAKGPFSAIFCGNLSVELLESELFGYKKGAFTGAVTDKLGLLDITNGGTLFLDEIADVPMSIQAKLLRFLQNGEYQRVGDPAVKKSNTRILSATNKNLAIEIEKGTFRQDLFYRLNVLVVEMPPLSKRDGDIPLLSGFILNKLAERTGQPLKKISTSALQKLGAYDWPGNVRELENVLARAAVLTLGDVIEPEDLDLDLDDLQHIEKTESSELDLEAVIENHIKYVLKFTKGNRSEAARLLGVSRRYLQKLLVKWREEME